MTPSSVPSGGPSLETVLDTAKLRLMYSSSPEARREALAEVSRLKAQMARTTPDTAVPAAGGRG